MIQRLKKWFFNYGNRAPRISDLIQASYSTTGEVVSPRTILSNPAVLNGVRQIATTCGRISYDVFDSDNRSKVKNHPAQKTLKRPGRQNPITLITSWVENAVTYGNGFLWILRDDLGKPFALELISPDKVTIVIEDDRIDYAVRIDEGHPPYRVESSDMLHLRGLSDDGISGLPLCQILADAFGLGLTLQKYVNLYFKNNAKPSLVIHFPPEVNTAEECKKFVEDWTSAHRLDNSHRPAFVRPGTQIETIGGDNQANQVAELVESDYVRIGNALGIPSHKIGGRIVSVAYGSLEQENLAFLDAIDFWISQIEQEFSSKLLTTAEHVSGRRYIEGNRRKLVQITPQLEAQLLIQYRNNGLLSDEEARAAINRPVDFSEGTFWLSSGLQPRDKALNPEPPPAPAPAPVEPEEEPQDEEVTDDQQEPIEDNQEDSEEPIETSLNLAKAITLKSVSRLLRRAEKSGKIELKKWQEEFEDLPGVVKLSALLPIDEIKQVLPEQRKYVLDQITPESITEELWTK